MGKDDRGLPGKRACQTTSIDPGCRGPAERHGAFNAPAAGLVDGRIAPPQFIDEYNGYSNRCGSVCDLVVWNSLASRKNAFTPAEVRAVQRWDGLSNRQNRAGRRKGNSWEDGRSQSTGEFRQHS